MNPDIARTATEAADLARHWDLDPGVLHLNHGSFGACPRPVLAAQSELRARLERDPMGFFITELEPLWDEARCALAEFVGAPAQDVALLSNATSAVSAVLRSLEFSPGDEILTTNHEYNACRNALDMVAGRAGARLVTARIPFPVEGPEAIVAAVLGAVTPRTRLLLIDHVTSPTALVLPIEPIIRACAARGIDTLVDGAHGPGMLDLRVDGLGCAYYAGNLHKWVCAPKGAAFLYVRPDRQACIRPLAISHGANSPRRDRSRFQLEFDWTGTDDPTAQLCIPHAIRWLGSLLPGGWAAVRDRNRALAAEARALLAAALGTPPPCPESMLGSMAALILETGNLPAALAAAPYQDPLEKTLAERYRIRVPVIPWPDPPMRIVRISAQLYNHHAQYGRLAGALREIGLRD